MKISSRFWFLLHCIQNVHNMEKWGSESNFVDGNFYDTVKISLLNSSQFFDFIWDWAKIKTDFKI